MLWVVGFQGFVVEVGVGGEEVLVFVQFVVGVQFQVMYVLFVGKYVVVVGQVFVSVFFFYLEQCCVQFQVLFEEFLFGVQFVGVVFFWCQVFGCFGYV